MYKTWQHNFKYGIKKFMTKTGQSGSFRRTAFNGLARTLGGLPLVPWKNSQEEEVLSMKGLLTRLRYNTGN